MRQCRNKPTKRTWKILALCLLASALAAAFAFSAPAQAQNETYVDLSIEISVENSAWNFVARNQGSAAAYGVTVDIEIADQIIHAGSAGFERKSGTTCSGLIPGTTCISGVWTVGALGAGEETSFAIGPRLASGLTCCSGNSDSRSVPARAVIKNTIPEEEERFKGDNTAVGWIYVNQGGTDTEAAVGRYWLEASVDDLLPDAGEAVKFKFTILSPTTHHKFIHDAKVRLKLDNGMGTPNATTTTGTATFGAADGLDRTWDWDLTLSPGTTFSGAAFELSTTLNNPLPAGVARSDLCLTADLTARPGNNLGSVDFVSYTSAEICLREDPVVLFQEGQATLFSIYPCVGVTSYPCSSADTIEMRVIGDSAARAAGVARDEALLDPARVFVHVKDPEGRRVDSHSGSVNSGTAPSWHTLRPAHTDIGDTAVDGVDVRYTLLAFASGQQANYSQLDRTVTVAGLAGSAAPGAVNIRYPTGSPDAEFAANPSATDTNSWLPANNTTKFIRFVEFEELGTYKLDYTATLTHTDTTNHPNPYSGTGSYIFHVGPVAELDVSDGGAGLAPSGTRAFTIVAVNNGPDDAPDVRVTGLNDGDYVSHSATGGSFNSTTGVWTIGELKNSEFYQDIYGRDGEILTIITSAAVNTEITASISNTQDYTVCIDSSGDDVDAATESACKPDATSTNTWHTAKYYDYIGDNDSATIEARRGTGTAMRTAQATAGVSLSWPPRSGSAYYVVEVSEDGGASWTLLKRWIRDTSYTHTGIPIGATRHYRVFAVGRDGKACPSPGPAPWPAAAAGRPPRRARLSR